MREIVTILDLTDIEHLGDFETCNHCGFKQDYSEWEKTSIKLLLAEVQGKHGNVVIIMECPECFEKVWVHRELLDIDYGYPKEWIKAVDKYFKNLMAIAEKDWDKSLCKGCKFLKGKSNMTTTAWRNCKGNGWSMSGPAVTECDLYKPIRGMVKNK